MYQIVVRAILRDNNGNILFVKRVKNPEKNKWSLPGGKVEAKENPEEAIIREIKEELSLSIVPTFTFYKADFRSVEGIYCLVLYFSGIWKGKIIAKTDEISDYKYFSKNDITSSKEIGFDHQEVLIGKIFS
jgi:mutator protein MutT